MYQIASKLNSRLTGSPFSPIASPVCSKLRQGSSARILSFRQSVVTLPSFQPCGKNRQGSPCNCVGVKADLRRAQPWAMPWKAFMWYQLRGSSICRLLQWGLLSLMFGRHSNANPRVILRGVKMKAFESLSLLNGISLQIRIWWWYVKVIYTKHWAQKWVHLVQVKSKTKDSHFISFCLMHLSAPTAWCAALEAMNCHVSLTASQKCLKWHLHSSNAY